MIDTDKNPCVRCRGVLDSHGYGKIVMDGKRYSAHRVAYTLTRGAIPPGLVIDHLCRNRWCINPSHMEMVTHSENVMRGRGICALNSLKTHCPSGHPLTPTKQKGKRSCKICNRERARKFYWDNIDERREINRRKYHKYKRLTTP